MSNGTDCPSCEELEAYWGDDLAPAACAVLEEHLASCPPCWERCADLDQQELMLDVPGYRIIKEIGCGRFGVVYKAWRLGGEPRIVAVKVLSCAGKMEKNRFDREIAVLKKIESPWIVKCLDAGSSGSIHYYVMDYVEGVHLDEYLSRPGYSLSRKLGAFVRVCRAVAAAHAEGVAHRDLKPRNIVIDADGQPHILDFGICALESDDWSSWERCTLTHPGDVIGTLKYMSPEQAWGGAAGPIDERSDIWALGVMLHEIVTDGEHPYALGSTQDKPQHEALLERIRKELPRLPRLESIPRGRDLEVLLARCLAWEPDRRIESAAKLADDVERYGQGRRMQTKPLPLHYRMKRLAVGAATRSPWLFSLLFIAALALGLHLAAFLFDVGWHRSHRWDHGLTSPSATAMDAHQSGDRILIVGVHDDTRAAVVSFAAQNGIAGVTEDVRSWRAVHGGLMERLADAGPEVVVWDYFFRTPQPGDARFAAGVKRLAECGVPVVLATRDYLDDGTPDLSPDLTKPLAKCLRHGLIGARSMVQHPGEFVVVMKGPGQPAVPGLVLAAWAAAVQPGARLDIDWPEGTRRFNLLYEIKPGVYLRKRDRIDPVKVFRAGYFQHAYPADNLLACTKLALQEPEQWARRTVPYQTLLLASDDELQARTQNRLIVFGDVRTRQPGFVPDRHPVKYGLSVVNDVPGCYLVANGIASLLDRSYLRSAFPLAPRTFLVMLLMGLVGCLLPVKLTAMPSTNRLPVRRILWVAALTLSALSFVAMVLTRNFAAVHLGMAGLSLFLPMAGSFGVEFARHRYRLLDRDWLALKDARPSTNGTITLASRQRRSLQETR